VSSTHDLAADVPALISELLNSDAGRPRVTWYGPGGERVEFSAKTLNNWISKTSNLLVDELDAGPGTRLGIALPAHWRTVVWLLAGWSVGAHPIVLTESDPRPYPGPPFDVLVTDRPSAPPAGTVESQLVVVALPALATRYPGDVPTGAGPEHAIQAYLAPLAAGGSVVIHHDLAGLTEAERAHLATQEAVTQTQPGER
jgi:uncharacterized protein (TIGR03089 family)